MQFFGLGKEKMEETQEKVPSTPWGSQLGSAVADARKAGMGRKERAKASGEGNEAKGSGSGISQETARKLAKMFEPEKWKPIVRAPFSLCKAKTGRDLWDLQPKEEETLAECTSAAAEHFMAIDPKYLVLTLLVFNWSVIVAGKVSQNNAAIKQEFKDNPPPELNTTDGVHLVKP